MGCVAANALFFYVACYLMAPKEPAAQITADRKSVMQDVASLTMFFNMLGLLAVYLRSFSGNQADERQAPAPIQKRRSS